MTAREPPIRRVEVRRAAARFTTRTDAIVSRHSFSFGSHYDPGNTRFGLLLASNDDVVAAGAGYPPHSHRDVEIVTWVLAGALLHRDSAGHREVLTPGKAQRISAGTGVRHSESNAAAPGRGALLHLVQMWIVCDEPGGSPGYEQRDLSGRLANGGLVTVVAGRGRDRRSEAMELRQPEAALHAARPPAGGTVRLPAAPFLHLYVARGRVDVAGVGRLDTGDAVRFTAADGASVRAVAAAELLCWEMHSGW